MERRREEMWIQMILKWRESKREANFLLCTDANRYVYVHVSIDVYMMI